MKEIKQKPAGGKPKTADAARVPKAVVKAAWLQAREAARAGEKQVVGGKDGAYSGAADTGEKGADKLVSTGERVTELAYRGGRKLAERSAGQRRERAKAAQTGGEAAQRHGAGETIAHTSTIEASRPPQTREAGRVSDENRPAGARPQQRESRAVGRAKPIKPGREMKQGAPGPKTTEQAGMRALVEALHSLLIALAAGGSVAVLIVVLICLIAFVAGSAYGIFFAAEAPGEDAFTVQQAVEQLGGEYRDYLQQIESTMPHDRQEIKANDDVYYIRWQDVLAVFSSYVSGAEDGAPVAYLDESRLQQLRQTMWDMNEVAYSTYTETVEIEADEPAGDENTDSGDSSKNPGEDTESGNGTESAAAKTVTQTVLLIELTHKTPDEMAQDYAYTARQQEYLDLLRAPEYETLWAELLGGFLSGGGEILAPAGAWQSTGPLQWPLPITGSITSPFGYRTDPITGEVSYHSGTDIAAPAGTPILAAADGTVIVANGVDSWGGSYGYYVKLDHGGGLQTLYAHCQTICVTAGQQVQAGQVIGYVGHTGRATGDHLHFEIVENGQRQGRPS